MRVKWRSTIRASVPLAGAAALLVAACSGATEDGLNARATTRCGPGTELRGLQCVPQEIDASPGETTDAGVEAPDSPADVIDAADAKETGPAYPPTADLCPSKVLDTNCSQVCGGEAGCYALRCRTGIVGLQHDRLRTLSSFYSYISRTPDKPGWDPVCADACTGISGAKPHAFAMAFRVNGGVSAFRVRVDGPWWIEQLRKGPNGEEPNVYCPPSPPLGKLAQGCAYFESSVTLLVWTDDPNAPARNITFEPVRYGEVCQ
jgi:hypothetical protein